jgi:hypothetical protein
VAVRWSALLIEERDDDDLLDEPFLVRTSKRQYNPDEPRDEKGEWTSGAGAPGDAKVEADKEGVWRGKDTELKYVNYTGATGNKDHITRTEMGTIPLAAVTHLKGVMGEDPKEHYQKLSGDAEVGKKHWDEFVQDIKENGIKTPIFITVEHGPGKEPMISEGNHRMEAARVLGLKTVPVEIRYFGHAEDQGTVAARAGIEQIKTSSTSTSTLPEGAHDFIQKQVNDFYKAGGSIKILGKTLSTPDLVAAQDNFKEHSDILMDRIDYAQSGGGPLGNTDGTVLDRMSMGISFMQLALVDDAMPSVAVAYDAEGNVAGAMSFSVYTPSGTGPVHIGYLGSMGTTPGTGTALQVAVAKVAATAEKDISSTATDQALSYHSLIGRTLDETNHSSWTKEQVAEVASLSP